MKCMIYGSKYEDILEMSRLGGMLSRFDTSSFRDIPFVSGLSSAGVDFSNSLNLIF